MKSKIRVFIQKKLGYWFYKTKHLPVGTDLFIDLKSKLSHPLNIIFDVGANIGEVSTSFSFEFSNSSIYSFEPIKKTYEVLEENTANLLNVKTFQIAFGEEEGEIEVELDSKYCSPQNSLLKTNLTPEGNSEKVKVNTIDNFINENHIAQIDLLKIDTEGFEEKVILGAEKSIDKGIVKLIYLEVGFSKTNKQNSNFLSIYQKLEELDYSFFGIYEVSQIGLSTNLHYGNALFVHSSLLKTIENRQLK